MRVPRLYGPMDKAPSFYLGDAGSIPARGSMITLTDENFAEHTAGTILVDFWADWCAPCKQMEPILAQIDELVVPVGKMEVEAFPEIAQRLEIVSIPTLILFKDGNPVRRIVGAQPYRIIESHIRAFL